MILLKPCRVCGTDHKHSDKLDATNRVAEAIAAGHDFGGVFDLANELAKARATIGVGGATATGAAHLAAVALQAIQVRVSREFARIEGRRTACRACEFRHLIETLIRTATRAVSDDRQGFAASWETDLIGACKELADYAGDDHPDEDSTQRVLELARDVFLRALAVLSPEQL